jgi:hypothetical protein
MNDNDSLVITRVTRDDLLPNFYSVVFNKNIDATDVPCNVFWLRANDELDAVCQVREMVASGEIKEVTL